MSDTPSQPVAGRFALLSLAGEGGMGTVWKARDLLTSQLVALKLLNLDVTQPDEVARFDREVSMLAELRHPGIVRYIAHGQLDSQAYLVMEWLEGQDLATRLAQKPLTATESGVLLRRVAQVLAVAHLHGIIHRDIKPWNFPLLDLPKFLRGEFRGNTAQLIPRFSRRVNKKIPDGTFGIGLQVRQIHWDFLAYRRYCALL